MSRFGGLGSVNDFMIGLSGPMMMPSEGMGAHPDAKQRVELSKEGVCSAAEPPKPKVRPLASLTNHGGCLLCQSRQLPQRHHALLACSNRCMCAEPNARTRLHSNDSLLSVCVAAFMRRCFSLVIQVLLRQLESHETPFWH